MASQLHLTLAGGDVRIIHVSQVDRRSRTEVIIDGELAGEYVCVAETCCTQVLASGRRLLIFLRNVSAVDESGRGLLLRLLEKGAGLSGSGLYTEHIVQRLRLMRAARDEAGSKGDERLPVR